MLACRGRDPGWIPVRRVRPAAWLVRAGAYGRGAGRGAGSR